MEHSLLIFSSSLKAIVFIACLGFLPGWLVCRSLNVKQHSLIWSHAFSVLIFSLSLWFSAQLKIPLGIQHPLVIVGFSLIILVFVISTSFNQKFKNTKLKKSDLKDITGYLRLRSSHSPLAIITLAVVTYLSLVGVYDLVPSDTLRHMERIHAAARDVADSSRSEFIFFNNISGQYHHYFYAYLMNFSGFTINGVFWIASALNSTIILWALYQFSLYQGIEKDIQISKKLNTATVFATLCLLLFVLSKGIAGFSFIRYYSLAPTLLSFSIFLVMVTRIDHSLRNKCTRQDTALITLGAFMLLFWHIQELLFVLTLSALLVFYYYIYTRSTHSRRINISYNTASTSAATDLIVQRPWLLMSIAIIISALVITAVSHWQLESPSGMTNRLVTLTSLLRLGVPDSIGLPAFADNIKLLNPFIQFSQVLGFWGVLVYVSALFHLKELSQKPLLICSLMIPFVTVFNPLFVDFFLRIRGEDTLYRLLYAVPLSVVAAFIITHSVAVMRKNTTNDQPRSKTDKTIALLSISLLIVGLLPFKSTSLLTQYNRLNNIFPIEQQQSLRHWNDLTNALRKLPRQDNILTDPVTGYVVTATTDNIAKRYKFTTAQHLDLNTLDFNPSNNPSNTEPFTAYKGRYLIINLRNGSNSQLGSLSTHWPENILRISNYYSPELLNYIHTHPTYFTILWQHDLITIYRIK